MGCEAIYVSDCQQRVRQNEARALRGEGAIRHAKTTLNGQHRQNHKAERDERMTQRRFPPPWAIDEANAACFIVRDANAQALGCFYFEDDPGRRSQRAC